MTQLQIKLQDGTTFNVEVKSYKAEELEERINDAERAMVSIGNAIIQKYTILSIMPLDMISAEETKK